MGDMCPSLKATRHLDIKSSPKIADAGKLTPLFHFHMACQGSSSRIPQPSTFLSLQKTSQDTEENALGGVWVHNIANLAVLINALTVALSPHTTNSTENCLNNEDFVLPLGLFLGSTADGNSCL